MMKLDHALHLLKARRALAILFMLLIGIGAYLYLEIVDASMSVNHPKFAGLIMGWAALCFAFVEFFLLWWVCRLCYGIWWLSGIKRRQGPPVTTVPVTFHVRFKKGAYDFL